MVKTLLFDFSSDSDISSWRIVDDGVMGGLSQGHFQLTDDGHGLYSGQISLKNNGGFSSLRYNPQVVRLDGEKEVVLHIKGDGKRYQCRLKSSDSDAHSYAHFFETSGEWETVRIPLSQFYPTFRGRTLDRPNYPAQKLAEFGILFGNKKAEDFQLQIDWIGLD
ncbi:MAG: CIA30 family protein [Bacteroidetes bacterium]|jgi:hypothetical protein|nr:CIA30 family protein [Bacteroidota bacterium]